MYIAEKYIKNMIPCEYLYYIVQ